MTMQLEHLRVLIAVADEGGFAAASRRLRVSPPAVTRAIAALEAHLGARLLQRTTRVVRLTDAGERFVLEARRILSELADAEAAARGAHAEPQGELAVTAPVVFGRLHLTPVLLEFLAAHPQVRARVTFVDRVVNLVEEGFDLALRIAELPDSSFTAMPLGQVRRVVVAAPAYLRCYGEPQSPQQLPAHRAVCMAQGDGAPARWSFGGLTSTQANAARRDAPQPRTSLVVNSVDAAIEAALAGHGLARVLSYQVREHLAAGRLQRVLQPFEPPAIPVQLVYPEGRKAAAKVRAFVAYAAPRLRAQPALQDN